jgi:hypothetical protein
MPFVAEAELTVAGPLEAAFAQFIDFPRWSAWMPALFRPLRGPSRPLRTGDRLLVAVAGAPTLIHVESIEAPREVRWSGGLPGLLYARHSFTFEAAGPDSTRIRSTEPWVGVLTRLPIHAPLKRVAERAGRAQLKGFERWLSREHASAAR